MAGTSVPQVQASSVHLFPNRVSGLRKAGSQGDGAISLDEIQLLLQDPVMSAAWPADVANDRSCHFDGPDMTQQAQIRPTST